MAAVKVGWEWKCHVRNLNSVLRCMYLNRNVELKSASHNAAAHVISNLLVRLSFPPPSLAFCAGFVIQRHPAVAFKCRDVLAHFRSHCARYLYIRGFQVIET